MAKQISAIKFIGSVGNLTGSKGIDGAVILREKVTSVANPQTVDQMNQRAKFKLAAQVAGMLGEVGELALKANGYRTGRRGMLNKQLMEKITLVGEQQAGLPRVLNLVKNPTIAPIATAVTINVTQTQTGFVGSFSNDLPAGMVSAKALLVYDRTTRQWTKASSLDANRSITVAVANPSNCDAYFYAELVVPTTAEGAARLNNLIAMNPGYTISVSRLDASNYGYTRTYNAGIVEGASYTDSIPVDDNYARNQVVNMLFNAMEPAISLGMSRAANANGVSLKQEFSNVNAASIRPAGPEYENLLIAEGDLTQVAPGEANFDTPLTVTVAIDDGYTDARFNSADDIVYLAIYSKTHDEMALSDGTKTRADSDVEVTVPGYWQGDFVETYIFVVGKVGEISEGKVSDSVYCGSGRIA